MRKRIIGSAAPQAPAAEGPWVDLDSLAVVEVTSEERGSPVEAALQPGGGSGWRAAGPGPQTIRLLFDTPRQLHRIRLRFDEPDATRTQEFVLRWSADAGRTFRDVVRQQWSFSPGGATSETEDYRVSLDGVGVLELTIVPDISGGDARASLAEWRVG